MNHTCIVDLDGVLVEFVRGSFKFHNKSIPIKEVRWNYPKQIGLSGNEFWEPLGYDFWVNLEWTVEGKELLAGLETIFGDRLVILSSPCLTRGCRDGKGDWVEKHIPHFRRRTFLGGTKKHFAAPNKILLDDHEVNIDEFAEEGGKTVLVPRPWNRRRDETCENGLFNVPQILAEVCNLVVG